MATGHREQNVPCTTEGCPNEKPFRGRCNPCQSAWEAENLTPLSNPYEEDSWVEECMKKQGSR